MLIHFQVVPIKEAVVNKTFTTVSQLNRQTRAARRNRRPGSATTPHRIMNNNIKKMLVLGLLVSLAGGITLARAEDAPAAKPAAKPATPAKKPAQPIQQTLTGKVVSVDKAAKTITLQINAQTYVLQLTESTKIALAGKQKTIYDVTVGEDISVDVLLKESANGKVEVVVLSVDLQNSAEAQGAPRKSGGNRPFQTIPNPANIDGPIISPHRNRK